jgi:iron complex outermembrane receptor protein
VSHTALFGVDYGKMDFNMLLSTPGGSGVIPPLDLYAPVYYAPGFIPARLVSDRNDRLSQTGIYAQDQIAFGNFRLMLSGRQDFADISSKTIFLPTNTISSNTASDPDAFTKRVGLLYLFGNGLAPYAAYSTSFEPQAGTDVRGTPFVPTTGEQYEAGFKYEPVGWNALLTVSVFDLTKQNVTTTDPANINFQIQTGEIRSRGVEFEGKARLWGNLDLIATYTYTDVKVTKSNARTTLLNGTVVAIQGKVPVRTPEHMASLWAFYKHTAGTFAGVGLGAGVRYVGETYGTDSNVWNVTGFVTTPSIVPAYTLVDAVINYDFGYANPAWKGLSASLNARNLFNKVYVAGCVTNNSCSYGEAQTVLGTMRYRW